MTAITSDYVFLTIYRAEQHDLEEEAKRYRLAHISSNIIHKLPPKKWVLHLRRKKA
jgi:hypothetical protein